jgi:hypothetical protein
MPPGARTEARGAFPRASGASNAAAVLLRACWLYVVFQQQIGSGPAPARGLLGHAHMPGAAPAFGESCRRGEQCRRDADAADDHRTARSREGVAAEIVIEILALERPQARGSIQPISLPWTPPRSQGPLCARHPRWRGISGDRSTWGPACGSNWPHG